MNPQINQNSSLGHEPGRNDPVPYPHTLPIIHSRSRSAPADQPIIPKRTNFVKRTNEPVGRPIQNVQIEMHRVPLPYHWEEATAPDGHTYFVDHNSKETTNEDPRPQIRNNMLQKHVQLCQVRNTYFKIYVAIITRIIGGDNFCHCFLKIVKNGLS